MSLAENLLNSIPNNNSNSRIAGSGSDEPHIVVDGTRTIKVPSSLKTIAVKGDKDVETVTIDCIRYWDGNDLSTFTVFINYTLPNGDDRTYVPESINVADDTISFDWVIGRSMTGNSGQLTFWIVAKKLNEDETLDKQWSSLKNTECSIADGGVDEIYDSEDEEDVTLVDQAISAASRATIAAETANSAAEQAKDAADRAEEAAERAESGGGSNISIDTTLTKSGFAADAKAVGDAIANVSSGGGAAIILTTSSTWEDILNAKTSFLTSSRQVLFEAAKSENGAIIVYANLVTVHNNDLYFFRAQGDTKYIIKITYPGFNKPVEAPEYIDLGTGGGGGGSGTTPIFQVTDDYKLQVSYDNGATWVDLATLPKGDKGDKGDAGNITINGTELKFFTGTQADYDALSPEEKENLFAIITDDPTQIGLIASINEILEWKNQKKIFSYPDAFTNPITIERNLLVEIGKIPDGKTIDDIVGIGLDILVSDDSWYEYTNEGIFRLSSGRTSDKIQDRVNSSPTYGGYYVPFAMSTIVGMIGNVGANIEVEICSSTDGTLYFRFVRGYCYYNESSTTNIVRDMMNGKVKLRRFYYWFA